MSWLLLSCAIGVSEYRLKESPRAAWRRHRDQAYSLKSLGFGDVLGWLTEDISHLFFPNDSQRVILQFNWLPTSLNSSPRALPGG